MTVSRTSGYPGPRAAVAMADDSFGLTAVQISNNNTNNNKLQLKKWLNNDYEVISTMKEEIA